MKVAMFADTEFAKDVASQVRSLKGGHNASQCAVG